MLSLHTHPHTDRLYIYIYIEVEPPPILKNFSLSVFFLKIKVNILHDSFGYHRKRPSSMVVTCFYSLTSVLYSLPANCKRSFLFLLYTLPFFLLCIVLSFFFLSEKPNIDFCIRVLHFCFSNISATQIVSPAQLIRETNGECLDPGRRSVGYLFRSPW